MKPKLLFFDIDGTLAMPGCPPSEADAAAIRAARARGCGVFLSTGRSVGFIDPAIRAIGFDGGIYHAGGRVLLGERVLLDCPMEPQQVHTLIELLRDRVLNLTLEAANCSYGLDLDFSELLPDWGGSTELRRIQMQSQLQELRPLSAYRDEPVYKISFFGPAELRQQTLEAGMPPWAKPLLFENLIPGLPIMAGEVSDRRCSKAAAMEVICRELGCAPADCAAFGDSMNDAEILEAAGIGVAMGNAPERVKALADRVCEPCADSGVARELARMGLA